VHNIDTPHKPQKETTQLKTNTKKPKIVSQPPQASTRHEAAQTSTTLKHAKPKAFVASYSVSGAKLKLAYT
jgi:hypothetical protein